MSKTERVLEESYSDYSLTSSEQEQFKVFLQEKSILFKENNDELLKIKI